MSQHQQGGTWSFGQSKGATDLFEKRPTQPNQYGVLREFSPNDCRELEGFYVPVSYINATQEAMTTPYYNSRSTKMSFVLNGQADLEMACPPHISLFESEEEQGSQQGKQQQAGPEQILSKCKGRTNIWKHLESEAKKLALGIPFPEVHSILHNQKGELVFYGAAATLSAAGRPCC